MRNTRALRAYRHRVIEADKRRRAARKAKGLEASRKARAKMRRPRRDEKMALLLRLLDAVLEVEPWNLAHHTKVSEAWEECGRQVPGYLKEGTRTEPRLLVQQQVFRLGDQLIDPTAKTPWKSYQEVEK
ncbi:unnamed protein product, partial [Ectocarpus sp. 6 AP-2014]